MSILHATHSIKDLTEFTKNPAISGKILKIRPSHEVVKHAHARSTNEISGHETSFVTTYLVFDGSGVISATIWSSSPIGEFQVGDCILLANCTVKYSRGDSSQGLEIQTDTSRNASNISRSHAAVPPFNPSMGFYPLSYVSQCEGKAMNAFAAVLQVLPVQNLTSRAGRSFTKRDVIIGDPQVSALTLTLWDDDVYLADAWTPRATIIRLVGMTVRRFRDNLVVSLPFQGTAQVVTQGFPPSLKIWMQNQPAQNPAGPSNDISSEAQYHTIAQVLRIQVDENTKTSGFVVASLMELDTTDIKAKYCSGCRSRVNGEICTASQCMMNKATVRGAARITAGFMDHTGMLERVGLFSEHSALLLATPAEVLAMTAQPDIDVATSKAMWRRYRVTFTLYFDVQASTPRLRVVNLTAADSDDVACAW